MAFSDYSATPSENTSIAGRNVAPGGPPSAVGPALRQIMADGKLLADAANSPDYTQIEPPTSVPTAVVSATTGLPNGGYYYRYTFVTAAGETEPSQSSALVTAASKQIDVAGIAVSPDTAVTKRRLYRTRADAVDSVLGKLVTEINNNTTTTFTDNVADDSLGTDAPYFNTTGGDISINGEALLSSSTSSLSIGHNAGRKGYASTFMGVSAGSAVTNGFRLTGYGVEALYAVTTGYELSAFGIHALGNATTARWDNAFGYGALQSLTTAESCNAFGHRALVSVTTGSRNDGFGSGAGILLSTGTDNSLFGFEAGWALTTGVGNLCAGVNSGHLLGAGNFNTFLGYYSGPAATATGSVGVGFRSLYRLTSGGSNVAIGPNAGAWLTTQSNRLFIDNQERTDLADAEAKALIVGTFDTTAAAQTVRVNAVLNVSESIQVAGVKVVGARGAAVANATDAASVIARLNDLLVQLRTHGLIAP